MTKKHEVSEQEYIIYKKQHAYEDAVETEQGKIDREKASYVQISRKCETRLRHQLRGIRKPEAVEDSDDENFELTEDDQTATRIIRNARTHKHRLTGLWKHEE